LEVGLIIGAFFFAVQFLKLRRWNKYFINYLELKEGKVTIRYIENNYERELQGNKNQFKAKKETAFNRTKTVYLAFHQDNKLKIKQFEMKEWTEKLFDEVVAAFN
jgi:hypothetical protein